jgi:hypothetical protein
MRTKLGQTKGIQIRMSRAGDPYEKGYDAVASEK